MKRNNSIDNSSVLPKDEAHAPAEPGLALPQEIDQWYCHDHEYLDEIELGEIIKEIE